VVQVFEFREAPDPMIIMEYYPDGNIVDALIISDERRISAVGQILDGLSYLHAKGLVHRNLKPENLLVKLEPFQVAISDFGMSKVVPDFLKTFSRTSPYAAPEVYPGQSHGYGCQADVWSLGVITLELMYGLPPLPAYPRLQTNQRTLTAAQWRIWIGDWTTLLLARLNGKEDQLTEILLHVIEVGPRKRWSANKCLAWGFENGLFKRRLVDGLVIC
jgi:serine/threonine protein kinase